MPRRVIAHLAISCAIPHTCGVDDPPHIPWLESAPKNARWLVGVSGGADSVAMLHLMVRAGFRNLVICHLDHRLRGRASTADARFVISLAKKLGHPCESQSVDVAKMADGKSLEASAREARHAFFANCARSWKCRRLILAHHADDQAETILWNLLRGSHGIKGMEPLKLLRVGRTRLEIHRPLLETRRKALVKWLSENQLKWREDATNSEPFTVRNRLRNEAIPLLDDISGRDACTALNTQAHDARDAREILEWAIQQSNALDPDGRIHLPALRALPSPLRCAVIAKFLADHCIPVSRDTLARCMALADPRAASATNLPGGLIMRRRAGRMWIEG